MATMKAAQSSCSSEGTDGISLGQHPRHPATEGEPKTAQRSAVRRSWAKVRPYVFVLPALLGALAFTVYPVIYAFYLSLHQVDVMSESYVFVGLGNYLGLLQSQLFHQVIGNTVIYMASTVALTCIISIVLGIFLSRSSWLNSFVQGAIFSPHVIPLVSLSLLWLWLMNKDVGLLNLLLHGVGLPKLQWVESPDTSMMSVIMVSVWKGIGFNALLVISALRTIPSEIIEAAKLDMAGPWTLFRKIKLPLISPTIFFMVIVNIIGSFQVYDSISVMTGGGPVNSTNVIAYWIYQTAFSYYRIGEASAGSIVLFIIVGLLTIFNFRISSSRVHYQ